MLIYTSKAIKPEQAISFDAWYKRARTPEVKQYRLKREEKRTQGCI